MIFGSGTGPGPHIAGCPLQPLDNIWNTRIDGLPLHPRSSAYIASFGRDTSLHPDFGTIWEGALIGIPYVVIGYTLVGNLHPTIQKSEYKFFTYLFQGRQFLVEKQNLACLARWKSPN